MGMMSMAGGMLPGAPSSQEVSSGGGGEVTTSSAQSRRWVPNPRRPWGACLKMQKLKSSPGYSVGSSELDLYPNLKQALQSFWKLWELLAG